MKRLIFLLCALICAKVASAQVYSYRFENRDAFKTYPQLMQPNERMVVHYMPSFNVDSLLEDDLKLDELGGYPFRFGYGFDVDYNLGDGKWIEDGDRRVWNMRFYSEGAYSLNFIFSEMTLSPEAELYIFSADGSMVYGPVTAGQNIRDGRFSTILLKGKDVVIQLIEPATAQGQSLLSISQVVHGHRNTFPAEDGEAEVKLLNCHNNVCSYSTWDDQSDAVARVLLAGTSLCSGALINNTSQDYTPYFLSAFHCLDFDHSCSLSNLEKLLLSDCTFEFQY
jgi:hypothetical protein